MSDTQSSNDYDAYKGITRISGGHRQTAESALALHRSGKDVSIKAGENTSDRLSDHNDYWLNSKDGMTYIMYEARGKDIVEATLADGSEVIISG